MKIIKQLISLLPKILTDSFEVAFAILGGISIVLSFTSFSLDCVGKLPVQIGVVVLSYIVLVIGTIVVKQKLTKNEVTLDIRGMKLVIREGDILKADGWKIIPFNEYFDTQVDDIVIAHSSLNGMYIDSLNDMDKESLKRAIITDINSPLHRNDCSNGTKTRYELGTIKIFQDVMMLALTHFNEQNEAYTNRAEYEHTLRKMWKEIRRTYQGKQINIPLIGGGLTQLDDMAEKPNEQLLKCILCTLQTSSVTFDKNIQINIILTKKALETINLYELKGKK
ncbi:MAG: macro domain-containing protein [bacterium]